MRVLHLITAAQRRGAELFGVELDRALRERGHESEVVALTAAPSSIGLPVRVIDASRPTPRALWRVRKEMGRTEVSVAHGSRTLPICALSGRRFVYRSIGDPLIWSRAHGRRLRTACALRRASRVVALWGAASESLQDHLGVPPERLAVIPNAADASHFAPPTPEQRAWSRQRFGLEDSAAVVGWVGAVSPEKDLELALRSLATLPDVELLVAGDGPDRDRLEVLADRAGARASFLGVVRDVRAVYHAADAVLLTSRTEGLPGALIEASLCGVPVVSTDVGGVRDVVADGQTGCVVAERDPHVIADALRAALSSPEMGLAGRRRAVERFDMPVVAEAWDILLRSVVDGA